MSSQIDQQPPKHNAPQANNNNNSNNSNSNNNAPFQQQQQPPQNMYANVVSGSTPAMIGGGQQRGPMAWQPTAAGAQGPYAGQQGYYTNPYSYMHVPQQQYNPRYPPQYNAQQPPQYNPQQQQQQYNPRYPPYAGANAGSTGMFYPPTAAAAAAPAPVRRERKPLTITDKDGKVISIAAAPSKSTTTTAATTPAEPAVTAPKTTSSSSSPTSMSAADKLRQAILDKLEGDKKTTNGEGAKKETEPAAASKQAQSEPEKPVAEMEAKSEKEDNVEKSETKTNENTLAVDEKKPRVVPSSSKSLSDLLMKQEVSSTGRQVYSKSVLLDYKSKDSCQEKPDTLPDLTITKGQSVGGGGGRGGYGGGGGSSRQSTYRRNDNGGNDWSRGQAPPRRQSQSDNPGNANNHNNNNNNNNNGGGGQWSRGQAPPERQRQKSRGGRGNNNQQFEAPVAPLKKGANSWRPKKNSSEIVVAEKKVKSILNKMTKEKFERLSKQMLEIPVQSDDFLRLMINNVYDKAIDEPSFGDIYAELCVSMSKKSVEYIKLIESDEEPLMDGAEAVDNPEDDYNSDHVSYRWTSNISTADAEVVGPFESVEECRNVALANEDDGPKPVERGDMELELIEMRIKRGTFMKIMRKKTKEEGENDTYYVVYFPVADAEECGQQLSDVFLSDLECSSNARKTTSFKKALLNKCEDEFKKKDIYVDWKAEKAAYLAEKDKLSDAQRAEKEDELSFRRIRIKKQMLGNVKFIGQLYKKNLIKERIARFCIADLLKLEEVSSSSKLPEYHDNGDNDIDEEDHEAICSMFTTIGSTIDKPGSASFVDVCFDKISKMSDSKDLIARTRFMYKDLIELRENNWVPRRKEEKAKTLDEIRKEVEHEEMVNARQSAAAANNNNYSRVSFKTNNSRGGGGGGGRQMSMAGNNRHRPSKILSETDEDGFTTIGIGKSSVTPPPSYKGDSSRGSSNRGRASLNLGSASSSSAAAAATSKSAKSSSSGGGRPALSEDMLKKRINGMITDYINSGKSVDELMLSMDEISGTPQAGETLVAEYSVKIVECKDNERKAVTDIVSILFEKNRLQSSDITSGLADQIEFIDSTVVDAPKAYEYFADLMAPLLVKNAFDMKWLCDQLQKTSPGSGAPEKFITALGKSIQKTTSTEMCSKYISSSDPHLKSLLGDKLGSVLSSI